MKPLAASLIVMGRKCFLQYSLRHVIFPVSHWTSGLWSWSQLIGRYPSIPSSRREISQVNSSWWIQINILTSSVCLSPAPSRGFQSAVWTVIGWFLLTQAMGYLCMKSLLRIGPVQPQSSNSLSLSTFFGSYWSNQKIFASKNSLWPGFGGMGLAFLVGWIMASTALGLGLFDP